MQGFMGGLRRLRLRWTSGDAGGASVDRAVARRRSRLPGIGWPSSRSRRAWATPADGTRHWRQLSRSRKVTVSSVRRLAVDGDAERRPRLVLAAIAAADRPLLVEEDVEVPLQVAVDRLGHLGHAVLLDQREDGRLDRGEPGVELQDGAGLAADLVLGVRLAEERQRRAVGAGRGLDDVGDEPLLASPRRSSSGPCR